MIISVIRTVIIYFIIIFALRLMGKRQISQMQTTELVVTLLISDIAAMPMQNTSQPLLSGIVPILVLLSCEVILSVIMLKSPKFRKSVCGKPVIIINDGKIDQKQLRLLRMSIEDLCEQLRQQNIFSFSQVQYAIVETNGRLSVLKKPENREVDAAMLGIPVEDSGIEAVIINDGEISETACDLCNIDHEWIAKTLQSNSIALNEVFIMTADKKRNYNIISREKPV